MTRPPFEVADIFRRYGQAFRERCGDSLSALQRQVMTAIERCRTAALFLDQLERAFRHGRLRLSGTLAPLADPAAFHSYLRPLRGSEWVVYSKPPFDGPARVLDYVGRYTHRVALL